MKRQFLCALTMALFLLGGRGAQSQEDMLAMIPAEAEVIAYLNVQDLMDSGIFDAVLERYGRQKAVNQAKVLQNLSGLDVFNDIQEIYIGGLIDQDGTMITIGRGAFDEEKLLDLVRINPKYENVEVYGITVHHWQDNKEHYACFLPGGLLALGEGLEAMEALLATRAGEAPSFLATQAGKALPKGLNQKSFWGILTRTPETSGEFGRIAGAIELQAAILTADLTAETVDAKLVLVPERAELADLYSKAVQGALAMAQLASEEHELAAMAAKTLTAAQEDGAIAVSGSLENEMALGLIAKARKRK